MTAFRNIPHLSRHHVALLLMAASMAMLLVFQGLWLRKVYDERKGWLEKEAGNIFEQTVFNGRSRHRALLCKQRCSAPPGRLSRSSKRQPINASSPRRCLPGCRRARSTTGLSAITGAICSKKCSRMGCFRCSCCSRPALHLASFTAVCGSNSAWLRSKTTSSAMWRTN